jgi:hypothetical protein
VASHIGRFTVLLEPLPSGEIGKAPLSCICQARVNLTNDRYDRADIGDGQTGYLESNLQGAARVLWRKSRSGQKRATIRLGNPWPPIRRFAMTDP